VPAAGLAACLGLPFWVEPRIWAAGLTLAAGGLIWHVRRRHTRRAMGGDHAL
jgi:hypothetical protein